MKYSCVLFLLLFPLFMTDMFRPPFLCEPGREHRIHQLKQQCEWNDAWDACLFNEMAYVSVHGNDRTCDASYAKPCATIDGVFFVLTN